MKRPLCLLNGPLVKDELHHYVNLQTGDLLNKLAKACGGLSLVQPHVDAAELESIGGLSSSPLEEIAGLRLISPPVAKGSLAARVLARLKQLYLLTREIRNSRWVYIFAPGSTPRMAATLCRLLGKPYSVYLRGSLDKARDTAILKGAVSVICNNPLSEQAARELNSRCHTIMPTLSFGREQLAQNRDYDRLPTRLLQVGRVTQDKGIPELLQAFQELRGRGHELELHLVGNGPLANPQLLPEQIREHVHFHGFISDLDTLGACYQQADIFVLATHHEGFPRVLYEAMTWGLPIVTTFVDGIGSIMQDEGNCLRIPVQDPEQAAAQLERLIGHADLRQRIGNAGRATMQHFLDKPRPDHAECLLKEMEPERG
jgi:glycosyltransferase involved in cell wall biosynthesis